MTQTGRAGTFPPEGVKAPCVVSSTSNITLSGTQTIGSTAVAAGDRVLARSQTDTTENGIWVAAVGAWTRATDMNTGNDVLSGCLVTDAANSSIYMMTFTGTYDAGTTAVTVTEKFSTDGSAFLSLDSDSTRTIEGDGNVVFDSTATFGRDVTCNAAFTASSGATVWVERLYIGGSALTTDSILLDKPAAGTFTITANTGNNIAFVTGSSSPITFSTDSGFINFSAADYIRLPDATTAAIKAAVPTPAAGALAYSTDDGEPLYGNGSIWLNSSDGLAA